MGARTFRPRTFRPGHFGHGRFGHGHFGHGRFGHGKNNILFISSVDEILTLTHPSRLVQLFQANTIETI